ncbi:MAG: hypothetical protein WCI11_04820 [Candidatus Methylumidiphilus sp.]
MSVIETKIHLLESVAPDLNLVSKTLDKLIATIADDYRRKLADYERVLAEYEKRHGMTTAEFQHGFNSGELGDAPEWFDWDGYAALAQEARNKLAEIEHGIS